jgi:hypothetical protein
VGVEADQIFAAALDVVIETRIIWLSTVSFASTSEEQMSEQFPPGATVWVPNIRPSCVFNGF